MVLVQKIIETFRNKKKSHTSFFFPFATGCPDYNKHLIITSTEPFKSN